MTEITWQDEIEEKAEKVETEGEIVTEEIELEEIELEEIEVDEIAEIADEIADEIAEIADETEEAEEIGVEEIEVEEIEEIAEEIEEIAEEIDEIEVDEIEVEEIEEIAEEIDEIETEEVKPKKAALTKEYAKVFTAEEQVGQQIMLEGVTLRNETIALDAIVVTEVKKKSRNFTLKGLLGSVQTMGILVPIHVMETEDAGVYVLLDGLRRVYAALRSNKKEISAVVWKFEDTEAGKCKANLIGLTLNKVGQFNLHEKWGLQQTLEIEDKVTPAVVEYLLTMEKGDSMKLKDIMTEADPELAVVKQDLYDRKYTSIDQAYRKLSRIRKDMQKEELETEDKTTGVLVENTAEVGVSAEAEREAQEELGLPQDEKEADTQDEKEEGTQEEREEGAETLNTTDIMSEARDSKVQNRKKGERINNELRLQAFRRDDTTCLICGHGGKSGLYATILTAHHKVPVAQGGADTLDNLATLCTTCHLLVHQYVADKVVVSSEFMTREEKATYERIKGYGNIILQDGKERGLALAKVQELNKASLAHEKPWEIAKANEHVFAEMQAKEKEAEEIGLELDEIVAEETGLGEIGLEVEEE